MSKKKWYFTFGQAHKHPETGESMKNNVIEVEAPTYGTARLAMVSKYGVKWAFQYNHMPEAHAPFFSYRKFEYLEADEDGNVIKERKYE